jgi:hypothetical protein
MSLHLTSILAAFFALATLLLALRLRQLEKHLTRLQPAPVPAKQAGTSVHDRRAFDGPLLQAALQQHLHQGTEQRQPPEIYRQAAELAGRGLSAERISELLQLPAEQARQVVRLRQYLGAAPERA